MPSDVDPVTRASARAPIPIFAKYLGHRVEAELSPTRGSVTIRTGALAGSLHESLTAAAIAVVDQLNPGRRHPNTNGRLFWRLQENGEPVRSILGKR